MHKYNKAIAKLSVPSAVKLLDGSYACILYIVFDKPIDDNYKFKFKEGETPVAIYEDPEDLQALSKINTDKITNEFLNKYKKES